jgi:hypothetical protein
MTDRMVLASWLRPDLPTVILSAPCSVDGSQHLHYFAPARARARAFLAWH